MTQSEQLMEKCEQVLKEYLLSDDNTDIAKADLVKKLFGLKSNVKSVQVTIKTEDKDVVQTYDIRYRRSEYPELPVWRMQVFTRDNFTCTECGSKKNIQAHHIQRWAEHPNLRFDIDNGQTLCKKCHSKTAGYMRKYNGV